MLERSARARLIALILASFLLAGADCAWSQQPPEQPRQGASDERIKEASPQNTNTDQPKTDASNAAIAEQSVNTDHLQRNANQDSASSNTETKNSGNWWDDPIARFTFLIAVFTFVIMITGICQWRLTRLSNQQQLRAYMASQSHEVHFNETEIVITLKFINAGQTPAHDVYVVSCTDAGCKNMLLPAVDASDDGRDKMVYGPSTSHSFIKKIRGAENASQIKAGTKFGFIWGVMKYRDIFNGDRSLVFYYRIGQNAEDKWILQPTRGGETAN